MTTRWVLAGLLVAGVAHADEGMWPFNMAPKAELKAKFGFEVTDAWLDRAMKSSVRFNNGGSGSFVSPRGLVMTNHHVGADCIHKLSQGEHDRTKDGFYAATPADEQRCPDLELNQLVSIEDVTDKVRAAEGKAGAAEAARNTARKAEMGRIEKACADATGLRCDVVTLYAGGAYHLYRYQKFTDVRLVFAPEFAVAFFGGEAENFTYPRSCFDAAFFRAYGADGQPVDSAAFHFPFGKAGAQDGDLVFVSGNPGRTGRLNTPAQLAYLRDHGYPYYLERLAATEKALSAYMAQGEPQKRAAHDHYFGVTNAQKALTGYLQGLKDPALMKAIADRHAEVQGKLAALPKAEREALLEAWPKLAGAMTAAAEINQGYQALEGRMGPGGTVMRTARHLLRLADELPQPSETRLREYRDSALDSLKLGLFSPAPIDDGLEIELIALGLEAMSEALGADHAAVKAALGGQTARARAQAVVQGTKLKDVAQRKALFDGGKAAVDAAQDPAIELARAYDAVARAYRKRYEDEVEGVERAWAGKIAVAWAKALGQGVYPDATFTLRLNHGVVKGYTEAGKPIAWRTTLADLFAKHDRAKGADPYALPKRWLDARGKLQGDTPYNFVTNNDIIGGNS
ncbi:MAG: S46 family peptidase, partial [Myxococcales bacterium]|nr:S46 family peptidase [Myxococcales bacterium]